jgi:hypothetical protein
MKVVSLTLLFLLVAVCVISLFQEPKTAEKTVTQTITVPGDSVPYVVQVKVPVPVFIDHIVDTNNMVVDTAAIIAKYLERVVYNDTIRDSSMLAILNETVSRNRIVERKVWLQNLRPQAITYTTTVVEPSPQWLAGVSGNVIGGRIGIGAGVVYVRKRDAFTLSVYTNGVQGSYMWKIK